jgi:hypothetical protein
MLMGCYTKPPVNVRIDAHTFTIVIYGNSVQQPKALHDRNIPPQLHFLTEHRADLFGIRLAMFIRNNAVDFQMSAGLAPFEAPEGTIGYVSKEKRTASQSSMNFSDAMLTHKTARGRHVTSSFKGI